MNAQLFNELIVSGVDQMPDDVATQLQPALLHLAPVGAKAVDLDFDGGRLSSDAGVVLLKDIDDQLGLTRALAAVLSDPGSVAKLLFREFGSLQVIEFLTPDFWILPKNRTLRQNPGAACVARRPRCGPVPAHAGRPSVPAHHVGPPRS